MLIKNFGHRRVQLLDHLKGIILSCHLRTDLTFKFFWYLHIFHGFLCNFTSFCWFQPVNLGAKNLKKGNVMSSICFARDVVLLIIWNKRTIRTSVRSYLNINTFYYYIFHISLLSYGTYFAYEYGILWQIFTFYLPLFSKEHSKLQRWILAAAELDAHSNFGSGQRCDPPHLSRCSLMLPCQNQNLAKFCE